MRARRAHLGGRAHLPVPNRMDGQECPSSMGCGRSPAREDESGSARRILPGLQSHGNGRRGPSLSAMRAGAGTQSGSHGPGLRGHGGGPGGPPARCRAKRLRTAPARIHAVPLHVGRLPGKGQHGVGVPRPPQHAVSIVRPETALPGIPAPAAGLRHHVPGGSACRRIAGPSSRRGRS